MTPIAELRELHAKATPGEWRAKRDGIFHLSNVVHYIEASDALVSHGHMSERDQVLIVAAVNALPALLDLAERAQAAEQRCADMTAAIERALACTPHVIDGEIVYDCGDPFEQLRDALAQTGRG